MKTSGLTQTVSEDGYAIVHKVFTPQEISELIRRSEALQFGAGTRGLLSLNWGAEVAQHPKILGLVSDVLRDKFQPVRAILFDKRPDSNWNLGWHQDTKIPVKNAKLELEKLGFSGWSVKEGVTHVRPPSSVLENMIAVRIHLDDCPSSNGPLRVIPGSHKLGFVDLPTPDQLLKETVCACQAGDIILMKPLLLHASSKSESPGHRRVIHIEFSSAVLPDGLEWGYS